MYLCIPNVFCWASSRRLLLLVALLVVILRTILVSGQLQLASS